MIHWIRDKNSITCETRLYENLFTELPLANNLFDVINND